MHLLWLCQKPALWLLCHPRVYICIDTLHQWSLKVYWFFCNVFQFPKGTIGGKTISIILKSRIALSSYTCAFVLFQNEMRLDEISCNFRSRLVEAYCVQTPHQRRTIALFTHTDDHYLHSIYTVMYMCCV